jgi:RNA-directed DNA polymerase
LKEGTFRPLPVRERSIPKPGGSGKVRKLGILPVPYGFRPTRRAHDAIAEIHMFGSRGYQWVLDADIEACFDSIDHVALMDQVRRRVKDKRVLALVKAFLKAGVLTERTATGRIPTASSSAAGPARSGPGSSARGRRI